MEDKELVEIWRNEHKALLLATNNWCIANFQEVDGAYYDWNLQASWEGFLMAKRSQPSVVLPMVVPIQDGFSGKLKPYFRKQDILGALTAAGIKYTIVR